MKGMARVGAVLRAARERAGERLALWRDERLATGELCAGMRVSQLFEARADHLSGVSVPIATYARENPTATIVMTIREAPPGAAPDRSPIVAECRTPARQLFDHDDLDLSFAPLPLSRGRRYLLDISSPDGSAGDAVSVWFRRRPDAGSGTRSFDTSWPSLGRLPGMELVCTPRHAPPLTHPPAPRAILYSPSRRCRLSCVHCASRGTRTPEARMPPRVREEIRALCREGAIDNIATDFGGDIFDTDAREGGGELDFLLGLDVGLYVTTHGNVMPPDTLRRLLNGAVRIVNVSIDAATPETHRAIRRGSRPLSEVLDNVRSLVRMRAALGARHATILLSLVPMRRNLVELPLAVERASEAGVDRVMMRHLQVFSPAMEHESASRFPDAYNRARTRTLEEADRASVCVDMPRPFEAREERIGHPYCGLPWESLVVTADGLVRACTAPDTVMGDLHHETLRDIWNGPLYQRLRTRVNSPTPPRECQSCPIFAFENNPGRWRAHSAVARPPGVWLEP